MNRSRSLVHLLEDVSFPGKIKTLAPMAKIDQWFLAMTFLFSLHIYKSFSVLPHYICVLGLIRSMWKTFNPLTYPLSYSSLQEEAVTKEKFISCEALVTKRGKGNDTLRANKICFPNFTWLGLQRH